MKRGLVHRAGLASLALAASGCQLLLDPDGLTPPAPIHTTQAGTVTTVALGEVKLQFDCAQGCSLFDLRLRQGRNLLWGTPYEPLAKPERLAGVSLYDHAYSWQSTADDTSLEVIADRGPVAQWRVRWKTAPVSGEALYTLHADGRLYRSERVEVLQESLTGWLLSYLALSAGAFDRLSWDTSAGIGVSPRTGADSFAHHGTAGEEGSVCAENSTDLTTVAFGHHRGAGMAGLRAWEVGAPSTSLLLASDWVTNGPVAAGSREVQTLTVIDAKGCAAAAPVVRAWLRAAAPTAEPAQALATDQPGDSDGDGFNEGTGCYELLTDASRVVLRNGSVAQGSATLRVRRSTSKRWPSRVTLGGEVLDGARWQGAVIGEALWLRVGAPWAANATLQLDW